MPLARAQLEEKLRGSPLVLDGATGTEIERLGVPTSLPLWSASALWQCPELLEGIHRAYADAGADLLTANTFRTQRRALAAAGRGSQARELTLRAVQLARRAAEAAPDGTPLVLGSAAPLADCYRPDLVPDDATLAREHAEHVENLARAGVDAVIFETLNSVREARAATRAAHHAGVPFLVSFVCDASARLLSGEALETALEAVSPQAPLALAVNCLPPSAVDACLPALHDCGRPFGVYANLGEPDAASGFRRSEETAPRDFAAHAVGWLDAGAHLVGGCCGTTPAHLLAVVGALREWAPKVR